MRCKKQMSCLHAILCDVLFCVLCITVAFGASNCWVVLCAMNTTHLNCLHHMPQKQNNNAHCVFFVPCALLFCALCASWSWFHKSEAKVTSGALSHHIICQPRSSSPIFLLLLLLLVVSLYQETKMCSIFKTLPKSKPSQPPTSPLNPPLVHQTSTHPLGQIRARSTPLGRGGWGCPQNRVQLCCSQSWWVLLYTAKIYFPFRQKVQYAHTFTPRYTSVCAVLFFCTLRSALCVHKDLGWRHILSECRNILPPRKTQSLAVAIIIMLINFLVKQHI